MSLINEALKKAQRLRQEDSAVATLPEPDNSGPAITKRGPPMPARTLVLLLSIGGTVVVFIAGALAFYILLSKPPQSAPSKPQAAIAAPSTPPAPVTAPVASAGPQPSPALPKAPTGESLALPVATTAPSLPTPNPKINEFIATLRIAGLRLSATDPRVILNDRVFRLNDIVDSGTRLRLHKIEADALIFVDDNRFEYKKSFR